LESDRGVQYESMSYDNKPFQFVLNVFQTNFKHRIWESVAPNSNLPQLATSHRLNPRCSTYELNAFLPEHEDPSTLNILTLTLKITRYNIHQVPAKPDYLYKHIIIHVTHQQQEVGLNRNSRYFLPIPHPYSKVIKILE
jgi:hypothetical protein